MTVNIYYTTVTIVLDKSAIITKGVSLFPQAKLNQQLLKLTQTIEERTVQAEKAKGVCDAWRRQNGRRSGVRWGSTQRPGVGHPGAPAEEDRPGSTFSNYGSSYLFTGPLTSFTSHFQDIKVFVICILRCVTRFHFPFPEISTHVFIIVTRQPHRRCLMSQELICLLVAVWSRQKIHEQQKRPTAIHFQ